MTRRYAAKSEVSSDRSRAEIERTLQRYGASAFSYGWTHEGEPRAVVQFAAHERYIRFVLPMPDPLAREFTHTPGRGLERSRAQSESAYEQAVRQRWRALALVVKAKLEAVEAGIAEFEEEFQAYIVLPNGQTVGEWVGPQIAKAYASGSMPPMLPSGA